LKDLSYGKNPGQRVAQEGIIFNSLEEGAEKISQRLSEIGSEMDRVIKDPRFDGKVYDLSEALKPVDEAISNLSRNPRTNANVIKRLNDARDDILGKVDDGTFLVDPKGMSVEQAVNFKRDIASMAKYTGAASDDGIYNKAIQQSARNVKNKVNDVVPEMSVLNERWADLKSAETAIRYRDKIVQRQNILKFSSKLVGGGSVLAGTAALNPAVIAAGFLTIGVEKILSSSAFKTRFAKCLPLIKPILDRIFGKDKELSESKILERLNNYKKDVRQPVLKTSPTVGKTVDTKMAEKITRKQIANKEATIIDPDELKAIAQDFNPNNHPKYAKLAERQYEVALAENPNPLVKFTAGGPGSGKGEIVLKRIKEDFDGIINDGTMAKFDKAVKNIRLATEAGKDVEISLILPDIEKAWNFTKAREASTGRGVPREIFLEKHQQVMDTMVKLIESKPDLKIRVLNTRGLETNAEKRALQYITDKNEILNLLKSV